jgi:hypothetical protein
VATTDRREAAADASAPPPIPADAKWIEVRVVAKATGQPVAGAEVDWINSSSQDRIDQTGGSYEWLSRDRERVARRFGWHARSDTSGVVRAAVVDWCAVFARHGDDYGSVCIDTIEEEAPSEGWRIELVGDLNLRVQVLDAAGQPAPGVPIAVAQHGTDGASLQLWRWMARSERPDGMTVIRHLQEMDPESNGNLLLPTTATWRVRVDLPGCSDPGVAFDREAPPTDPVVLRLPPCGRVAMRTEWQRQLTTERPSTGLYKGELGDCNAQNNAWSQAPDENGWTQYPWIPVGASYVGFSHLNATLIEQQFFGPTIAGQEVRVVLAMPDDTIVLTGRLLDERRELIRGKTLSVDLSSSSVIGGDRICTDAQGRFIFALGKPRGGDKLHRFEVQKDQTPLRASLGPRDLRPGPQDVGDLVFDQGPRLVAGRFTDKDRPYTKRVQVQVEHTPATGGGGTTVDNWYSVDDLTMGQDGEGNFAVHGTSEPGRYRLTFPAWDHLPIAPIEFPVGASDLVVQIAAGTPLSATALLPAGAPDGIKAVLRADAKGTPNAAERLDQDRNDRFRFTANLRSQGEPDRQKAEWLHLPSGTYTLELRLWGIKEPILVIPDVTVPPPTAGDPRLDDIDLRDKVAMIDVRAVDAVGKALTREHSCLVFLQPQDPLHEWIGFQVPERGVSLLVKPGPIDLLVAAEGYRPKDFHGVRGEVLATLEPWPEVELTFPNLLPLPEGFELLASLSQSGISESRHFQTEWEWTDGDCDRYLSAPSATCVVKDGRVSLPIGEGSHQLRIYLRRGKEGDGDAMIVKGITPAEVFPGPAVIEVQVPSASLQVPLNALQKKK